MLLFEHGKPLSNLIPGEAEASPKEKEVLYDKKSTYLDEGKGVVKKRMPNWDFN